jgi:hypothetical protein
VFDSRAESRGGQARRRVAAIGGPSRVRVLATGREDSSAVPAVPVCAVVLCCRRDRSIVITWAGFGRCSEGAAHPMQPQPQPPPPQQQQQQAAASSRATPAASSRSSHAAHTRHASAPAHSQSPASAHAHPGAGPSQNCDGAAVGCAAIAGGRVCERTERLPRARSASAATRGREQGRLDERDADTLPLLLRSRSPPFLPFSLAPVSNPTPCLLACSLPLCRCLYLCRWLLFLSFAALSIRPSVSPSAHRPSVWLICLSVCLSVCLWLCLSVCLSVCPSRNIGLQEVGCCE